MNETADEPPARPWYKTDAVAHAVALLVVAGVATISFRNQAGLGCRLAQRWVEGLPAADQATCAPFKNGGTTGEPQVEEAPLRLSAKGGAGRVSLREALERTQALALRYAAHHLSVTEYFFSRYYAASAVALVATVLAGVFGALFSRRGWEKSDPYITTLFIAFTAVALTAKSFPAVFKQQENAELNRAKYTQYVNLASKIALYAQTSTDDALDIKTLNEFWYQLAALNGISFGIDIGSVPEFDRLKAELEKSKKGPE